MKYYQYPFSNESTTADTYQSDIYADTHPKVFPIASNQIRNAKAKLSNDIAQEIYFTEINTESGPEPEDHSHNTMTAERRPQTGLNC